MDQQGLFHGTRWNVIGFKDKSSYKRSRYNSKDSCVHPLPPSWLLVSFSPFRTYVMNFIVITQVWEIKRREQGRQCVFPKYEAPKQFDKFNEYARRNEPSDHWNKLPEYPMLGSFGKVLHYPCIIKWDISLPCCYTCLFKHTGSPERWEKNKKYRN